MSKNSANFDPAAFAELNSAIEDVKSRLSKNASNTTRTEEKLVSLKDERVALEAELRTKTNDLEAMARKGVSVLTRKGNVSSDLVNLLLRLPADDGQPSLLD